MVMSLSDRKNQGSTFSISVNKIKYYLGTKGCQRLYSDIWDIEWSIEDVNGDKTKE